MARSKNTMVNSVTNVNSSAARPKAETVSRPDVLAGKVLISQPLPGAAEISVRHAKIHASGTVKPATVEDLQARIALLKKKLSLG